MMLFTAARVRDTFFVADSYRANAARLRSTP